MAKEYFGEHSLRALIRLVKNGLGEKMNYDEIANDLVTADDRKALSAAQGKVLDEKIKALDSNGDGIADNAAMLGGHTPDYFATAESVQEQVTDQKGQPDGLAPLDSTGKVPEQYLPSYVDDVIEGYYDAENNKFYEDEAKTTEITGEKGKIYIDVTSNYSYRFGGTTYVEITSSDMVEIGADDVNAMWESTTVTPPTPPEEHVSVTVESKITDAYTITTPTDSAAGTIVGNNTAIITITTIQSFVESLTVTPDDAVVTVDGKVSTSTDPLATAAGTVELKVYAANADTTTAEPLATYNVTVTEAHNDQI